LWKRSGELAKKVGPDVEERKMKREAERKKKRRQQEEEGQEEQKKRRRTGSGSSLELVLEAVWSWQKQVKQKKAVLEAGSSLELAKKIGPFAADVVVRPVGEDKKMK
jgi:thymidylate synthase ThyX